MTHTPTYLFYDLETSGLNPAFDQILQFAAIRTDVDFRELERYEFRVRLRPDIIPSPGALLATDISVFQALTAGKPEYEAAREIQALVSQPGTTNLGYNSLSFDDQFLRFTFYRNLLPPYNHQWQNGCRRLDLFPLTVFYWLHDSPLLDWPTVSGKPTLKLEHLSQANGLATGQAHDALVDVAATVALTRRLRQDNNLWDACLAFFDKTTFDERLGQLPQFMERPSALLVQGKFGYDQQCQVPALYLGQSETAAPRHLWLRLDRPELPETTSATIAEKTRVIRQKPGEPPFAQPPKPHKLSAERHDTTVANMTWLQRQPQLLAEIARYHRARSFDDSFTPDADAALYANGFASDALAASQQQFHQASLPEKIALTAQLPDETSRELAVRLLCRHERLAYRFPSYQTYARRIRDEAQPLLDFRGKPRLTPQQALADITDARQQDLTPRQQEILDDLERYLRFQFGQPQWDS